MEVGDITVLVSITGVVNVATGSATVSNFVIMSEFVSKFPKAWFISDIVLVSFWREILFNCIFSCGVIRCASSKLNFLNTADISDKIAFLSFEKRFVSGVVIGIEFSKNLPTDVLFPFDGVILVSFIPIIWLFILLADSFKVSGS